MAIEFVFGALNGVLIACHINPKYKTIIKGLANAVTSLAHSFNQKKSQKFKTAIPAIASAIVSAATTIIIGSLKTRYHLDASPSKIKYILKSVSISRLMRGLSRASIRVAGITYNLVFGT